MKRLHDSFLLRAVLPRIGLIAACLIFFDGGIMLWSQGITYANPALLLTAWVFWFGGMASGLLALTNRAAPNFAFRLQWLVLVAFVALVVQLFATGNMNATPYTSSHADNEMIERYALEALKHGENPYTWNFTDAARVFRDSGLLLTPFLDGTYQNRLTYPALPTLVLWVFDRIGLGQVRILNLIALLCLCILLYFSVPRSIRALILLPLLILKPFVPLPLDGTQDIVWSLFLTGMVVAWRRPVLRGLLLGMAISYKQQTWFILPFLLILIWNTEIDLRTRWRQIFTLAGIALGVFAVINAPFFIANPSAWLTGVFEPLYAPFNMVSQGLGAFSAFGVLSLSREFYATLQLIVYLIALWLAWRHPRALGHGFWLIPPLFFWVYYRGLANYWIFWLPPLLVALFHMPLPKLPARTVRIPLSVAVSAVLLCVPMLLALRDLAAPAPLQAEIVPPMLTFYNGTLVGQLEIALTNHSSASFYPRFAVQNDPVRQALPWHILYGPESVAPGDSARYLIGVELNGAKSFPTDRTAQVVITDAKQGSTARMVLNIPSRADHELPDRLWNPAYLYWMFGADAPDGWTLSPPDQGQARLKNERFEGRWAVQMQVAADGEQEAHYTSQVARLSQSIVFPASGASLSIWVYPFAVPDLAQGRLYGVAFKDEVHQLRVLFGGQARELLQGNTTDATLILPAPLNAWSLQRISVAELYQQLGWNLPDVSWRNRNEIMYPVRQIEFSLIAAPGTEGNTIARFGEILLDNATGKQPQLLNQALDDPEAYYLGVAWQYHQLRNYVQAFGAYQTALQHNPKSRAAYLGLADLYLVQNKIREAVQTYQHVFRSEGHLSEALRQRVISLIHLAYLEKN